MAEWQSCSHCNVFFDPREVRGTSCPTCGKPLTAGGAPPAVPRWYYARDGRTMGPVSAARLKELVASGVVTPADLVRPAETEVWVPARAVKGLFGVPVARPATPAEIAAAQGEGGFVSQPQARQPAYELIVALAAVVVIGVWYALAARGGAPRPGSLLGHSLGVLGFLMMLSTETLYSLRKHLRGFHYGRMRTWLQVHIFTGIVGPFLVLLHSAGKFNGLAGVLTLLTLVIVLSGLVGRYVYTAVPRNLDGTLVAICDLEAQIDEVDRELHALCAPELGMKLARVTSLPARPWQAMLFRPILSSGRREMDRLLSALDEGQQEHAERMRQLLTQRRRSLLHVYTWEVTRDLLSLWHSFHVPLSGALFALAGVHVVAALYYGTLSR